VARLRRKEGTGVDEERNVAAAAVVKRIRNHSVCAA